MNDNFTSQSAAPQPPPAPAAFAPPPVVHTVVVDRKSPALAGFLSFFPGLGHLYLGLYPRAFAVGGAFILGIMMTSHGGPGEFFGPLIAFVWFFGIIDAVRQANAMNRGEVAAEGFAPEQQLAQSGGRHGRPDVGRHPRRPGLSAPDRSLLRDRLVLHVRVGRAGRVHPPRRDPDREPHPQAPPRQRRARGDAAAELVATISTGVSCKRETKVSRFCFSAA